jgi:hypothetical protein
LDDATGGDDDTTVGDAEMNDGVVNVGAANDGTMNDDVVIDVHVSHNVVPDDEDLLPHGAVGQPQDTKKKKTTKRTKKKKEKKKTNTDILLTDNMGYKMG